MLGVYVRLPVEVKIEKSHKNRKQSYTQFGTFINKKTELWLGFSFS